MAKDLSVLHFSFTRASGPWPDKTSHNRPSPVPPRPSLALPAMRESAPREGPCSNPQIMQRQIRGDVNRKGVFWVATMRTRWTQSILPHALISLAGTGLGQEGGVDANGALLYFEPILVSENLA